MTDDADANARDTWEARGFRALLAVTTLLLLVLGALVALSATCNWNSLTSPAPGSHGLVCG